MGNYILFGAGVFAEKAINLIGSDNIDLIVDNNKSKAGQELFGKKIYWFEEKKDKVKNNPIIISVNEKYENEIARQLRDCGISNFKSIREVQYEYTKSKIESQQGILERYKKAIIWIDDNTIANSGIICNTEKRKPYPEVTGYYIPTLIRWGYREKATSYAKWLCSIQKADGSWFDTDDEAPYIFDTAQILKGLIAIKEKNIPVIQVDGAITKGCDWIIGQMNEDGRLITPTEDAWGDKSTCSELIHLYCLSPLMEAGMIFNRQDYIESANMIMEYYLENCRLEIMNFNLLSHFHAYVMEALIDLGMDDIAREAMINMGKYQKKTGALPAYKNVDWVCSTGLFQLALVWFRLGELERGNKAFSYACKLQNDSGGWFGSYLSEENPNEDNTYFPSAEISWANKYFLDALYYKNKAEFEEISSVFNEVISNDDGRYKLIENTIEKMENAKILDVGCGKGRYLKKIKERHPNFELHACDISEKVMEYIGLSDIKISVGTMTNIGYESDCFDITYTCEALEHAIDIESAIKELIRVTKPGGKLIVVDKNKAKLGCMEIDECEQWFDVDELKQLMLRYCSNVEVITELSYEDKEVDGLFCGWIGKVI